MSEGIWPLATWRAQSPPNSPLGPVLLIPFNTNPEGRVCTLKRILLDRSKFQAFQWFQCQGWLEGIHQPFQPFLWWWRKWRYLHWHVAARQICLEIQVQCQAFEGNSARVRAGYLSRSFMRPDPRSQATKYFNLVCLSSCSVSFDSVNSTTDTAIRALLAKDFGCLIRIRTLDNFSSASRSSRVPPFKWNNFSLQQQSQESGHTRCPMTAPWRCTGKPWKPRGRSLTTLQWHSLRQKFQQKLGWGRPTSRTPSLANSSSRQPSGWISNSRFVDELQRVPDFTQLSRCFHAKDRSPKCSVPVVHMWQTTWPWGPSYLTMPI